MDVTLRDLVKSFPQDSSFQRVFGCKNRLIRKQANTFGKGPNVLACLLAFLLCFDAAENETSKVWISDLSDHSLPAFAV
jgi:hypothetical protein